MTTKIKKTNKTEDLTRIKDLVNLGLNKDSTRSEALMIISKVFFNSFPTFLECGQLPPSISRMLEENNSRIDLDEWDSEKEGLSGYGMKWDFNKANILIETINAKTMDRVNQLGHYDPNETTTIEGKVYKVIRINEGVLEPKTWWHGKKCGISTLIHELVHMISDFNEIKTGNHNQKFMSIANHFGLVVEKRLGKKAAYHTPRLKDSFMEWFEETFDMEILNKIFSKEVINIPYGRKTKYSITLNEETFYEDKSFSGGTYGITTNVPSGKVGHLKNLLKDTNAKLRKHGYEEITFNIK